MATELPKWAEELLAAKERFRTNKLLQNQMCGGVPHPTIAQLEAGCKKYVALIRKKLIAESGGALVD